MVSFLLSLKMRIAVTTSNTELRDYTFTSQFRVEVKRSDAINNHVQFSRHYISSWFLQLHNIFNSIWLFPSYLLTLSLQFPAGIFRRSHQRCSVKKGVPEKFNKIHWKTPVPVFPPTGDCSWTGRSKHTITALRHYYYYYYYYYY